MEATLASINVGNGNVPRINAGSSRSNYKMPNNVVRYKNKEPHTNQKLAGSPPYIANNISPPIPTSNPFAYYAQVTSVPANVETTVVSYTVPGLNTLYIQGWQACSDADATYTLYVNNQVVAVSRTTPAELDSYVNLLSGSPVVAAGIIVKLTVVCTVGGGTFNGTLLGYYIS